MPALVKLVGLMKGSMVDAKDRRSIAQLIDKYNINFDSDREEVLAFKESSTNYGIVQGHEDC